jgi:hypothetical protein
LQQLGKLHNIQELACSSHADSSYSNSHCSLHMISNSAQRPPWELLPHWVLVATFMLLFSSTASFDGPFFWGSYGGVRAEEHTEAKSSHTVRFSRDIRPILSDHCFACHGPDSASRQADLRLDTAEELVGSAEREGAVRPGDLEGSLLWQRIRSDDESEVMPPSDHGKPLSPNQMELIERWIAEGATWEGHWAYVPLSELGATSDYMTESPADNIWAEVSHYIDIRIQTVLRANGLSPAPRAPRHELARRLSLDLTGLPPNWEQVEPFLEAEDEDEAYEKLVDFWLSSPAYGERMAMWWLDLVRYADSAGYHGDGFVEISPFRDYVIQAFNRNLPFDQFTLEQLAGDKLPDPTTEQLIASGYNRLGMMSAEGGVQPKEYLVKYMAERVRNLGGAWLGLTLGCCECHDHKFDPLTARDFYSFAAFFADIEEQGLYSGAGRTGEWGPRLKLPTPEQQAESESLDEQIAEQRELFQRKTPELTAARMTWENELQQQLTKMESETTQGDSSDSTSNPLDEVPSEIQDILRLASGKRSEEQEKQLDEHFRSTSPLLESPRTELARLQQARDQLEAQVLTTLVTRSVPPRTVRILHRGNWMDESGEIVTPGFPTFLPGWEESRAPRDRLDLAHWLVARDNPLTSRVFVNRVWKLFFGRGLSPSLDDFGAQGNPPTHPELLDELARRFVDSGWDVKFLVRSIVTSEAYRQSSSVSPETWAADPENRWFGRQGRFRLDAEMVRDNALRISGLLVEDLGGPSVKPYQPPGYWAYLNFPQREWENDSGAALYRRGLYTHWQRQYLHPAFLAFDAPSREECTTERTRSNTPLQALVLLNDPVYVEAARVLAQRILLEGGDTFEEQLAWAFRRAVARRPLPRERKVLSQLLKQHRKDFESMPEAAESFLNTGDFPVDPRLNATEVAAWTSVSRVILNLSETITRN